MTFDLYVFDRADLPDDEMTLVELLEDDTRWNKPLTPGLAGLVAELELKYPGLDAAPDTSPWASWPLSDSVLDGTGLALNIVWSQAGRMSAELRAMCRRLGLIVYDPQESAVIRPTSMSAPSPAKRKRWWKRE